MVFFGRSVIEFFTRAMQFADFIENGFAIPAH
jgi:hypothetical protein